MRSSDITSAITSIARCAVVALAVAASAVVLSLPAQAATPPAEEFVQANVQKGLTILNNHSASMDQKRGQFADFILGLGDYQYQTGSLSDYNAYFDKDWGPLVPKTYPVLAPTHDQNWTGDPLTYWNGGGAHGYKAPVTLSAHQSYSFDKGTWHFIAIDDSCYRDTGNCSPTALLAWVKADLAAHPSKCTLAYWHQAYFTSDAEHAPFSGIQPGPRQFELPPNSPVEDSAGS